MEFDASRFPLIILRWDGAVTDEELEHFIRTADSFTARAEKEGVKYAVVSVADGDATPKQRKRLADWANGRVEQRKKWEAGTHLVLRGALARGALTAIKWLIPHMANVHLHADEATAMAAAKANLAQANVKRVG